MMQTASVQDRSLLTLDAAIYVHSALHDLTVFPQRVMHTYIHGRYLVTGVNGLTGVRWSGPLRIQSNTLSDWSQSLAVRIFKDIHQKNFALFSKTPVVLYSWKMFTFILRRDQPA